MAISERIRYFRHLRGMTQKALGAAVGFPEGSADVRIAQYEIGVRTPKAELAKNIASVLAVSPQALAVPDIETSVGVMHTFFALEDLYSLRISCVNGTVCLWVEPAENKKAADLHDFLYRWQQMRAAWESGEIPKAEYDAWRYEL